MAYTIAFLKSGEVKLPKVLNDLQERLNKDGRFSAALLPGMEKLTKSDFKVAAPNSVMTDSYGYVQCIRISKVRLRQKKPYCGNHPGTCPLDGKKKPNSTLMEWDDWVAFHALVNRTLNKFRVHANVWSLPYDVKGRMWIRQDTKSRIRWDYTEEQHPNPMSIHGFGTTPVVRIWNQGTPDQFQP